MPYMIFRTGLFLWGEEGCDLVRYLGHTSLARLLLGYQEKLGSRRRVFGGLLKALHTNTLRVLLGVFGKFNLYSCCAGGSCGTLFLRGLNHDLNAGTSSEGLGLLQFVGVSTKWDRVTLSSAVL